MEIADSDEMTVFLRECWVDPRNYRLSSEHEESAKKAWPNAIHAIVIMSIRVKIEHRRQGHCRRFIERAAADPRFELCIVEGVLNPHLRAALYRWGWDCDPGVSDFYKRITVAEASTESPASASPPSP
jgi:hypothetical protein